MKPYPPRSSVWYDAAREAPRPVFGLDIDGTMGDYHTHFWEFAQAWCGKVLASPLAYDGSVPFWRHLGLSKATYRRVKLAYRQGGLKRSMPVFPFAAELTRALRRRGAVVVMCTTRPYLHLSNIEPDTVEWLRRNRIQYDHIIMGEHKYRDLARQYGKARIVAVVDDLPEMMDQARSVGLRSHLKDATYNRQHEMTDGHRAKHLTDILHALDDDLDSWEGQHR